MDLHPNNFLVLVENNRVKNWLVVDMEYCSNENGAANEKNMKKILKRIDSGRRLFGLWNLLGRYCMKVLFLAGWYPNEDNPSEGVFVREHAKAAALFNEVAVIYGRKIKSPERTVTDFRKAKKMDFWLFALPTAIPFFEALFPVILKGY